MPELTEVGQIKKGDIVQCVYRGRLLRYIAEEVLHEGTDKEEVIVDLEENKYFITSMAIDGTSWAKEVVYKSR